MRLAWTFSLIAFSAASASDLWLARVAPVLSKEERARYLSLNENERETFRTGYFDGKRLTGEEYFARVTYIDEAFGSGTAGSGANTDQGRLFLALGPPTSIHRVPSSRIFVPTEVWFYDHVPGLSYSSRLQFLFFRARDTGFPKLYNPQLHTIRALLLPQAATRGTFPVNDIITGNDVLNRLNASPAEQEVVEASLGVARGITGSGNSEILAQASSPAAMLRHTMRESAQTRIRFVTQRPKVTWTQYRTAENDPSLDLDILATAQAQVAIEVVGVDVYETQLNQTEMRTVEYSQRLFLLPGRYSLIVTLDGLPHHFQVDVTPPSPRDPIAPAESTLSYRANLYPGAAPAALGRQHLRAGRMAEAQASFERSLAMSRNPEALTGLAKLDALAGRLDQSRDRLREVLSIMPNHFEALVALGAVTAEFQDWPEAARYYRRALAVRRLAAVEVALSQVEARLRDAR